MFRPPFRQLQDQGRFILSGGQQGFEVEITLSGPNAKNNAEGKDLDLFYRFQICVPKVCCLFLKPCCSL